MPTVAEELEELRRKAVTKSNAGKLKNARGLNTPSDIEEALKQKAQQDKEAKKLAADILHNFNEAKQVDQDSDMRLKQTAQKREDQEKKKRAADILHSFNDAKASAVVVVVPKKLAPHVESGSKEGGAEPGEQAGMQKPEMPVAGEPGAEAAVVEGNPEAVIDNEEEKSRESEAAREGEPAVEVSPPAALETAPAPEEANSAAPTEEFDAEKMPDETAMEEPTATTKDAVAEEPVMEEPRDELPIPEGTNVATKPAHGTDGEKHEAGIDAVLSPSHPHNDPKQDNEDQQQQQQQPTEMGESVEVLVLQEPADEITAAVKEKLPNEPVADQPAPIEEKTVPVDEAAIKETKAAAFATKGEQDQMKSPPKSTDVEQTEEKEPVQTSTGATSPTHLGLALFDPKAAEVEMGHNSDRPSVEMGKSVEESVLEEPADKTEPVADEPAPVEETTVLADEAATEETKAAAFASMGGLDQMKSPPKTADVEQTEEKEPVQTSTTSATSPSDLGLDLFDPKAAEVEMGHNSDRPSIEMGNSVEESVLEEPADERNAAVEEKLANEPVANEPAPVEQTTFFVEAPAIEETKAAASKMMGEQDQMKSPKTADVEQPKENEPVQTPTSATWPTDLGLDLCSPKDPTVEHAGCCVLL